MTALTTTSAANQSSEESATQTKPTPAESNVAGGEGPQIGRSMAKPSGDAGDFRDINVYDAGSKVGRDFMGIFAQIHVCPLSSKCPTPSSL